MLPSSNQPKREGALNSTEIESLKKKAGMNNTKKEQTADKEKPRW
jgi:hypothetical protein